MVNMVYVRNKNKAKPSFSSLLEFFYMTPRIFTHAMRVDRFLNGLSPSTVSLLRISMSRTLILMKMTEFLFTWKISLFVDSHMQHYISTTNFANTTYSWLITHLASGTIFQSYACSCCFIEELYRHLNTYRIFNFSYTFMYYLVPDVLLYIICIFLIHMAMEATVGSKSPVSITI